MAYDDWKSDTGPWPGGSDEGDEDEMKNEHVDPTFRDLLNTFAVYDLDPGEPKTGQDITETARRAEVARVNTEPGSRAALEAEHGAVYDTKELQESFAVEGFMAPYVVVRRKADNVRGTLTFQHQPRFYFSFVADK